MRLTLRKSEFLDDWYVIERAEHEGEPWVEDHGDGTGSLRDPARFSDADVEGTAAEMCAIATAIEKRDHAAFRRCAVSTHSAGVSFWSPRNSQESGYVSLAEADELAALIRKELGNG